jgi:hypothetical protein
MVGAYTYILPDREAALQFVRRSDIWWYTFPVEDEDWEWRRGGAWKPAHEVTQEDMTAVPHPPSYAPQQGAVTVTWETDEDDDDRW